MYSINDVPDETLTFGSQIHPVSPLSLWLSADVTENGTAGTISTIMKKEDIKASQTFDTKLGTTWELIEKNSSKTTASLGIGMSGKLSAIKGVRVPPRSGLIKLIDIFLPGVVGSFRGVCRACQPAESSLSTLNFSGFFTGFPSGLPLNHKVL
ncbi:14413_t:CDS:2 [Ambispora leptoticha]|uniref:14413_t:CDS:1 n=1 Tax=Ambispora leptoticha TaxID=144679 RepID=A0A9N9CF42_9GLOM|nr:14413_t:CDS:2 [Ambispora leptoticha]